MYKVELGSNSGISLEKDYESQADTIKAISGVFEARVKEIYDSGDMMMAYGEYYENLGVAKKITEYSDRVAKVLNKNLMAPDNSSLLILNVMSEILSERSENDLINLLNNITHREFCKVVLPCEVDYITIVSRSKEFTNILKNKFRHDTYVLDTKLGYKEVDIFIAKVE